MTELVTQNKDIKELVFVIRGQQVMLDSDLAELYGYEVKNFNRQIKNNKERFPDDFMFQIIFEEAKNLPRCNFFTMVRKGKNIKYAPYVFTELGINMLSSVLRGDKQYHRVS